MKKYRFRRWIRNWLNNFDSDQPVQEKLISRHESIDQPERCVRFSVYFAQGGRVVETSRYDRQKDRHHQGLYIVTPDQDFGNEIDKIITMESLK